jgi:hypothetical protein
LSDRMARNASALFYLTLCHYSLKRTEFFIIDP